MALSVILGAAAAPPLRALEPGALSYYSLGIRDGLASSSVYCILQDSQGLLWFGTFGGLSRWDGENFVTFRPQPGEPSLAASVIFALLEQDGGIWIGTDGGGISRFDEATESFVTWRSDPFDPSNLSSDRVLALGADSKGQVWAGTGDGVVNIIDPATRRIRRLWLPELMNGGGPPKVRPAIRCIVRDSNGAMWIGTEGAGLVEVSKDGSMRVHSHEPGVPDSLASNTVRALLVDSKGRIWAGLGDGEVDLRAGQGFEHAKPARSGLPRQAVRALAEDKDGTIWVGWAEAGLGTISPGDMSVAVAKDSEAASVRAIFRDRGGLMWVGLKDQGARAYNPRSAAFTRHLRLDDGTALKSPRGLAETRDGRLLVGTDGLGLLEIDLASGSVHHLPGASTQGDERKVYSVHVSKNGTIWYGTDGAGLFAIAPGGLKRNYRHDPEKADSLAADVVWSLHEDTDGTLWVGMEGAGLDSLAPGAQSFTHHRPDPFAQRSLRGASVRCVFRDSRGRLWVGTWDGGVSRLESDGRSFSTWGPVPGNAGSLGDASVNAIFEDSSHTLWIGTGGSGIERFNEKSGTFSRFAEEEGLAAPTVTGILESPPGTLWIATTAGVTMWRPEGGRSLTMGREDGFANSEVAQNSSLATGDGRLWFGGPSGITSFFPDAVDSPPPPPAIAITDIQVHGNGIVRRDRSGDLLLDWRNAGLSFTIGVLDFSAPSRNRYAMRIEGIQTTWTQLGHINSGYIAPLSPGTWILAATGANGNGVWSPEGTRLAIRVEAPFWGKSWFAALVSIFLAAIAASAVLLRIRVLQSRNARLVHFARHVEAAREEERSNAAREVHDSIGQHLVVLNLQAWWLASHPEAPLSEREPRVAEMRGAVADAMGAVKNVATSLRPVALDALSFGETLRWYVRDFSRKTRLAATTEVEAKLPHFSDEAATALFRVLQEALANVARHAGACEVRVTLRVEDGWLLLEVTDSGVGMREGAAAAHDSFGLIGMRERCAALGGSFRVGARAGGGTRLLARVPVSRLGSAARPPESTGGRPEPAGGRPEPAGGAGKE